MKFLSLKNVLLAGVALILGAFCVFAYQSGNSKSVDEKYYQPQAAKKEYNGQKEAGEAWHKFHLGVEPAKIINRIPVGEKACALVFSGLPEQETIAGILEAMHRYNAKGTFFVEGSNGAGDPEALKMIVQRGQKVGNFGYVGLSHMEGLPLEKIINEFVYTQKVFQEILDVPAHLGMARETDYTREFLECVKASGLDYAVKGNLVVPLAQINTPEEAKAFVKKVKAGDILVFPLTIPLNLQQAKEKTDERAAVDKQPSLQKLPEVKPIKDIDGEVELVLAALHEQGIKTVFIEDYTEKQSLSGKRSKFFFPVWEKIAGLFTVSTAYAASEQESLAQEHKMLYTTEQVVPFTFTGLAQEASVHNVLQALKSVGGRGTFFLTEQEMKKHRVLVEEIKAQGNELAMAIYPKPGDDYGKIRNTLLQTHDFLRDNYGIETKLVKQFSGPVRAETQKAISNLQYTLIGNTVNVVQTRHKNAQRAEEVMKDIFGAKVYSVGRGWIIQIRMDYYNNPQLAADMLLAIKRHKIDNIAYASYYDSPTGNRNNDSAYVIKPVGEILNNKNYTWQYPVPSDHILSRAKMTGPVDGKSTEKNFLQEMKKRYIGFKWVNEDDRMLGFSTGEIRNLDKIGRIHTHDNVVFFTFDDWGTDAAVNHLLYVLRKHNVFGNFFVLTHNVPNNPNLLRAVAMEGHDVCAHSNFHKPMAIRVKDKGPQIPTQNLGEMIGDYRECYQRLLNTAGDISYEGKPVVCKYFRPPTLAISKAGAKALLEDGFEYIVAGSASTEDYSAPNLKTMINRIKDAVYFRGKVRKGAVLVMHMSDTSAYTAYALDAILTANEQKSLDDPSRFMVGRLSDYLKEDYNQGKAFRY